MSHPLWYTRHMIMKEYKATYTNESPQEYPNGKVTLERTQRSGQRFTLGTYHIMNWHSFDDMGASLETVQVWNPITKRLFEIYSSDEGETFTFGQPEPYLA
jgi:hypothetical protein